MEGRFLTGIYPREMEKMHFVDAKGILTGSRGYFGMNIYRGCTHGCIYCDSRSRCYHFTHAFEDIEVKQNAPALLEAALRSKRKKCMIGTGSMSDPYMHCEEQLHLTRKCLEIILKYGFGASLITKSDRILMDLDLLDEISRTTRCVVQMTLTTFDDELCRILEPNVCVTSRRIEVLEILKKRGIPTIVWMTPILPFINDTEENIEKLVDACAGAGVKGIISFGMGLTLREGDREYYYAALDRYFPGLKDRYIRTYGNAYELPSPAAETLMKVFSDRCRQYDIMSTTDECFAFLAEFPSKYEQLSLFDEEGDINAF
jgi:DNA repair photolyase